MFEWIRWKAVIRDVVILSALGTFGLTFLIRISGIQNPLFLTGGSFLFFMVVFTLIGYMAKADKWKHLFVVTGILWLLSILWNVIYFHIHKLPFQLSNLILPFISLTLSMAAGGMLSHLFIPVSSAYDPESKHRKISALALCSFCMSVLNAFLFVLTFSVFSSSETLDSAFRTGPFLLLITAGFGVAALIQRCFVKRRFWWLGFLGIAVPATCAALVYLWLFNMGIPA